MIIKLLLLSLLTVSCSQFVNRLDDDLFIDESIPYKEDNRINSCEENENVQLLSRNKTGQDKFLQFIAKDNYTYIEKIILWTFVQMNLNPHLSSPSSTAQIIFNGDVYLEIKSSDSIKSPIFYGLQKLLTLTKNKRSLKDLATIFDRTYPNNFFVSQSFSVFLNQNKDQILKNKILSRNFVRAEDTLRENERIPKQNFSLILDKNLKNDQKVDSFSDLKKFETYHCNFDIKGYLEGSFSPKDETYRSNVFGLKVGSNTTLISLSSNTDKIKNYERSIFIEGEASDHKSYVCIDKKKDRTVWIMGSGSRDPAQQVSQFLVLSSGQSKKKIISALKAPRYIRLDDPKRLIFESEKATKDEINNLQDLKIPLYSTSQIGNIAAYLSSKQTQTFFLDLRSPGKIQCGK